MKTRHQTGIHTCLMVAMLMAVLAMSGCGFKLRGHDTSALTLPAIFIQGPLSDNIKQALNRALINSGTQQVSDINQAGLILLIKKDQRSRRVLSVNASGQAQEFELRHQIDFDIKDGVGQTLLSNQSIRQTKDYTFSQTEVLAKDREEQSLYRAMQQQLIWQILNRLQTQAAKAHKPDHATSN